jgi:hypothetical protein
MLDAIETNSWKEQELDKEWLILLVIAKQQGLTVQEAREFFQRKIDK